MTFIPFFISKFNSEFNNLGDNFSGGRKTLRPGTSCNSSGRSSSVHPGSFRSFNPRNSIYKTPIKQGRIPPILQVSVSLVSPFTLSFYLLFQVISVYLGFLHLSTGQLWRKCAIRPCAETPGRPGDRTSSNTKSPKSPINNRSLGVTVVPQGPVRPAQTPITDKNR